MYRALPRADRETLIHELEELFRRRAERRGRLSASLWYLWQAFSFSSRVAAEGTRAVPQSVRGWACRFGLDVGYAGRGLLRSRAYVVIATTTLGVGVGGVATVYGVADWILLRDVPAVTEPEGLAWLRLEATDRPGQFAWAFSELDRRRIQSLTSTIVALSGSTPLEGHLRLDGSSLVERLPIELVTTNYFSVLGMSPHRGRFFAPEDYTGSSGPAEVVISHDLWRSRWNAQPRAIGSIIVANGEPFTVIGIAPPGFRGAELPGLAQAWFAPGAIGALMPFRGREFFAEPGGQFWRRTVGRMAPEATTDRVEAEVNAAVATIREESEGAHSFRADTQTFRVYQGVGLSPWVRPDVTRVLRVLGSAAVVLLLLAVFNVANLSLARAASRRTAIAVRRALGAGRWQVLRIPLLEGVLLGTIGGAAAWGTSFAAIRLFEGSSLSALGAPLEGIRLDGSLAWACVALAVLAGMAAGALPGSWSASRSMVGGLASGRFGDAGTGRVRSSFVVLQVALSSVLVVSGGLAVRTVANLRNVDLGVESSGRFSFGLAPSTNGYSRAQIATMVREIERSVEADPAVASMAFISPPPFTGRGRVGRVRPWGSEEDASQTVYVFAVTPGFFNTLDLPVVHGRSFRRGVPEPGVVVTTRMVDALFPNTPPADAVGRSIAFGPESEQQRIIGVTGPVRLSAVADVPFPTLFRSWNHDTPIRPSVAYVAGAGGTRATTVGAAVRGALTRLDPELPMYDVKMGEARVASQFASQRIVSRLASILAGIGLFLCALGLFGLLSYVVTARTKEFGVKMALGAGTERMARDVVRGAARLTGLGLLIGLPAAWGVARLVAAQLYGVGVLDPMTYLAGAMALIGVSLAAAALPMRRATRISPVEALRAD